eukprot:gene5580-7126_t
MQGADTIPDTLCQTILTTRQTSALSILPAMRFPPLRAMLCLLLILAAQATLGARCAQAAGTRTVLVLYSLGSDSASAWQQLVQTGLNDELASKRWGDAPNIFEERFDSLRVGEQAALDSMAPYLRTKYANVKLDAIVTENHLAAGFLNSHPDLFPGVPRYYVNHGRRNWRPGDGEALELAPDYGRMLGVIPLVAPSIKRVVEVGQ